MPITVTLLNRPLLHVSTPSEPPHINCRPQNPAASRGTPSLIQLTILRSRHGLPFRFNCHDTHVRPLSNVGLSAPRRSRPLDHLLPRQHHRRRPAPAARRPRWPRCSEPRGLGDQPVQHVEPSARRAPRRDVWGIFCPVSPLRAGQRVNKPAKKRGWLEWNLSTTRWGPWAWAWAWSWSSSLLLMTWCYVYVSPTPGYPRCRQRCACLARNYVANSHRVCTGMRRSLMVSRMFSSSR